MFVSLISHHLTLFQLTSLPTSAVSVGKLIRLSICVCCVCVCQRPRALKEKPLELSTPNLLHVWQISACIDCEVKRSEVKVIWLGWLLRFLVSSEPTSSGLAMKRSTRFAVGATNRTILREILYFLLIGRIPMSIGDCMNKSPTCTSICRWNVSHFTEPFVRGIQLEFHATSALVASSWHLRRHARHAGHHRENSRNILVRHARFPRAMLATCSRGCHEDATSKLLP